jgi:hypothetical protein
MMCEYTLMPFNYLINQNNTSVFNHQFDVRDTKNCLICAKASDRNIQFITPALLNLNENNKTKEFLLKLSPLQNISNMYSSYTLSPASLNDYHSFGRHRHQAAKPAPFLFVWRRKAE